MNNAELEDFIDVQLQDFHPARTGSRYCLSDMMKEMFDSSFRDTESKSSREYWEEFDEWFDDVDNMRKYLDIFEKRSKSMEKVFSRDIP